MPTLDPHIGTRPSVLNPHASTLHPQFRVGSLPDSAVKSPIQLPGARVKGVELAKGLLKVLLHPCGPIPLLLDIQIYAAPHRFQLRGEGGRRGLNNLRVEILAGCGVFRVLGLRLEVRDLRLGGAKATDRLAAPKRPSAEATWFRETALLFSFGYPKSLY